jgi:hypothetical protein
MRQGTVSSREMYTRATDQCWITPVLVGVLGLAKEDLSGDRKRLRDATPTTATETGMYVTPNNMAHTHVTMTMETPGYVANSILSTRMMNLGSCLTNSGSCINHHNPEVAMNEWMRKKRGMFRMDCQTRGAMQ